MVVEQKVRKGYKLTELGEIPIEWEYICIGEVLKESKECNQSDLPLLSITRNYGVIPQDKTIKRDVSAKDKSKYKVLRPGRLVYNTMRMWQGVSAISNIKGIISPAYTVCTIDEYKVDSQFLGYLFKSPKMINQFYRYSQGLVDDTLNLKYASFSMLKMVLPPLEEQRKISEILFSVDEQIGIINHLIEKTKELRKGLMQQLLTKGIGHTEFKETDLGMIPEAWDIASIKELSSYCSNGFVGTATPYYTNKDSGLLYLQSNNIRENKFDFTKTIYVNEYFTNKYTKAKVQTNDLLTVQSGHIGTTTVVTPDYNGVYCHALIITRPLEQNFDSNFLAFYLNSEIGRKRLSNIFVGSTIKHINVKDFVKFRIPVPSIKEQQKIVEILSSVDQQIEGYEQEKQKYTQLKKGLMQQLLTGKVRVKV